MQSDTEFVVALRQVRQENVVRLLIRSSRSIEEIMLRRLRETGFEEVKLVHLTLLRNIDLEGTRITEIADRAMLTKQAIGQLVKQCEEIGYVRRIPDPDDGRASIVLFTEKGKKLVENVADLMAWVDRQLIEHIGERRLATLKSTLRLVVDNVEGAAGEE